MEHKNRSSYREDKIAIIDQYLAPEISVGRDDLCELYYELSLQIRRLGLPRHIGEEVDSLNMMVANRTRADVRRIVTDKIAKLDSDIRELKVQIPEDPEMQALIEARALHQEVVEVRRDISQQCRRSMHGHSHRRAGGSTNAVHIVPRSEWANQGSEPQPSY
ncbi:MAG: hypothetical protein K9M03_04120 [Kiritimatiellales bacterium]|nr:hypothetical protein [Kiritimatiellales bacterium]